MRFALAALIVLVPLPAAAQTTPTTAPPLLVAPTVPAPTTVATAAASATAGSRVRVRFAITPATATIVVKTADQGSTTGVGSSTLQVASGRLDVTIAAPGYQTLHETLTISSTGATITRRLDPTGQLHHHLYDAATGSNPKQVSFTPDGTELWVPLLGSRGVDVFRASDGVKLTTIKIGDAHGAVEVVFRHDGTRAYVSQMETASVYEVDARAHRVLRRFATNGNWTKVLALSPDEKTLYAANWISNDVSVIDVATGQLVRKIPTVKTPRGLALDTTGTKLFVAGFDGGEIQRINLVTGEKAILLHTGGAMRHMALDAKLGLLYADDMGTSGVYVVDLATEKVRQLATVDSHPNTMDLSPDGRYAYVSNRGTNNVNGYNIPGPDWGSVIVIDTTTGKAVDAIIGGNQTTGLDVSPDGTRLAFTDFLDNRLNVYEIPPSAVLESGNGGLAPTHKALLIKTKAAQKATQPVAAAAD